jgi:hypothetical protein
MKNRNKRLSISAALFSIYALFGLPGYSVAADEVPRTGSEETGVNVVPAEFRGCESARACRFWIETLAPFTESLSTVRPNGVSPGTDGEATAIRNRLNFLMSDMIHQHKRIELQDLRKLDDGSYAATVKVNGTNLNADPVLNELKLNQK